MTTGNSVAFAKAREVDGDRQTKNQAFWENLPMTYADWDAADRSTDRDRVMRDFLDGNPFLTAPYFQRFRDKDVLEIGCGAGPATCLFADAGARVTAVDLTSAAVELTQAHEPRARVLQMDAEQLSLDGALFDHVFSWGVLHHSSSTEQALSRIPAVMHPGATGLIMVYNKHSLRYWLKGLAWLFLKGKIFRGDNMDTVQRHYTDGYFQRHFTPAELRAALRNVGLEPTATTKTHMAWKMFGFLPRPIDDWLKRRWGFLLVVEFAKPGPA